MYYIAKIMQNTYNKEKERKCEYGNDKFENG